MTLGADRQGRPLESALAEAALGRVLQALVQMPGLPQVAEATLNACRTVTGASEVYVLVRDGDMLRLEAALGLPFPEVPVELRRGNGLEGEAFDRGETVQRLHPADDPSYFPMPGRGEPPGVLVAVPLRLRGAVTGVLVCARPAAVRFSDVELRWLQHFADILSVAAENARLLAGERRSRSQAEVLSRVSAVEGSDILEYSQRMAEALVAALGVRHAGVLLHDRREQALVVLGWAPAGATRPPRLPLTSGGALAEALGRNELWVLEGGATVRELTDALDVPEPGSALAIPLPGGDGPRGILLLLGEAGLRIDEGDTPFLRLVAERVALTLHRTEVELEHARSQARQEFLSVVSHELRTPLAVIKAYTEVLARRAEGRGPAAADDVRILANVAEQVELMQSMVEHLLDLQRLDGGQLPLELSRFDLAALAARVVEVLQATSRLHRIELEAPAPVSVIADRRRIHEVLTNLVENAIKYSPDGGTVTVRVTCSPQAADGGMALVTVTDQGVGISADDLPRIFERFYQGNLPPYRGRRGMGLGLAIAREIVVRHGGQMWVQSEPDRGSVFSFSLPLAGPEPES